MIAVTIPAHNEEELIAACLQSVWRAARHPALSGEPVRIIVALDRCTDATRRIAEMENAELLELEAGNVGLARAAAANRALELGARWIATTDADSRVPDNWLASQVAIDADVFCGVVRVDDWSDFQPGMEDAFITGEDVRDGHPHVHGANMGFSAEIYRKAGGYEPLEVSEDVALVHAFKRVNARISCLAEPRVATSPRRDPRAKGGFGDFLKALEARTFGSLTAADSPVSPLTSDCALFIDLDGTLADFAPTPDAIDIPASTMFALSKVAERLSGAVAIVSGRTRADLARRFPAGLFELVGIHGLDLVQSDAVDHAECSELHQLIRQTGNCVDTFPGVLIEDKQRSVALHYRNAPEAEGWLRALVDQWLRHNTHYRRQDGDMVIEVLPAQANKGAAVEMLMRRAPFARRRPVYVGDDHTDEAGFAAAAALGGRAIVVGSRSPTMATERLAGPLQVVHWLTRSNTEIAP